MNTEMLRFFERGGLPMIVLLVLTIVVAVNLCIYFFVHQARFRAHEAASGGGSPAQAAAPGEPVGGERDAALSPSVVSPEARPSTTEAAPAEAAPAEAGADPEATRGATNASTTGEENAGSPRRAPADARQANAASLTEMTGGSLSAASTAASTAASASSASAAQYGSAAAVQYAASDTSPGDEAAEENPMPEFPPQGMPPWMRQYLND